MPARGESRWTRPLDLPRDRKDSTYIRKPEAQSLVRRERQDHLRVIASDYFGSQSRLGYGTVSELIDALVSEGHERSEVVLAIDYAREIALFGVPINSAWSS